MEQPSRYVSQLKVEFDRCDTTATGFLDREQLTELCRKLELDPHLLLDRLLGGPHSRVTFEEFKDVFVAVLSRSLDFSTSEDDSSYLEPAVPEEVKPKFTRGPKRYGRRSRPDAAPPVGPEDPRPGAEAADSSPAGGRRAKVRRSTSLESVESLKSEEETGSPEEHILPDLQSKAPPQEDLDLDLDLDFQKVLCGSAPISCSTPMLRASPRLRPPLQPPAASGARQVRSTSPSLLTASGGHGVLSRLDEGSGCTGPHRVLAFWAEEGIRNSREILQALQLPLEERLLLLDLTVALDQELLGSGNGIHQAALVSYRDEVQHLQELLQQACRQRDKMKAELEQQQQSSLEREMEEEDRRARTEAQSSTRTRELEQAFRDRLAALRSRLEQEGEAQLQQAERERSSLQGQLLLLRGQEAELQEQLSSATQESSRLEAELRELKAELTEAERCVKRQQRDLDQLLLHRFGGLDPAAGHEERLRETARDYELQCRELRDRNDELSSELELLKNQRSNRKSRRSAGGGASSTEPDGGDMKRCSYPQVRRKLQPADKTPTAVGPSVSLQTELALGALKQKQEAELQQLHIQLETQVNFYERSLELMRRSMEVERKDISQAFKMEISELEEQKAQVEQQVKQLKEQLQRGGGGGGGAAAWSDQQDRRMQRERAELEQNFAREIGNLVQSLSAEKEQLGAELKLQADQELTLVRKEAELQLAEGQRGFWEVVRQVSQLKEELADLQAASHRTRRDRQRLQDATGNRTRVLARLTAELVQDLGDQVLDQPDGVSQEGLQEALQQTRTSLDQDQEKRSSAQTEETVLELNSKTCTEASPQRPGRDLDLTGQRVLQLQRDLQDSRDRLQEAQQDYEEEKRKMRQQLMELEDLVLDLEEVVDPARPHRTRLEEVRLENGALQERLGVLQQEVRQLEDQVDQKRRRLEQLERDHERRGGEEERLHSENSRYREEVLALSGRNLTLADANAELSARLREDRDSARRLQERLEQQEAQQEQQEATLARVVALEAELTTVTLKLRQSSEAEEGRSHEVETLQRALLSVESEAQLLREEVGVAREVGVAQKVEELEREKEELRQALEEQEVQASVALQEETHKLRVQNQELRHQLVALQVQSPAVQDLNQHLNQEQQNLKTKLSQLQAERARDQAELLQVQHLREQEQQRRSRELEEEQRRSRELEEEQRRSQELEEEQKRSRQLKEALRLQAQQSSSHISMKQAQWEKVVSSLHQRVEALETSLKGVRLVLQEKVQQLKDQLHQGVKAGRLLKEAHHENSGLQAALQLTEQRQKQAEKKSVRLEERVGALHRLLREVVPEALAT